MNATGPFKFCTERRLVLLTGRQAANLKQLLDGVLEVSGSSIFYHTHHQYLSHHFEKPRFYNDFAVWVGRALQESRLAEKLAAMDLLAFTSVRQVREEIARLIRQRMEEGIDAERAAPAGDHFHFCESQSFMMPTGITASDAREFFARLKEAANTSLFFHFFEARLRLERTSNDFSRWLADLGEIEAAREIDALDPYVMTLGELRERIIEVGRQKGLA